MERSVAKLLIRRRVLAGLVIYFFSLYLFFTVFWHPQQERIAGLRAKVAATRQEVLLIESHGIAHPDGRQYLAELDKKLLFINQILPNEPAIAEFLVLTEQAAQLSSVQIADIVPNQTNFKSGYREISVTMTIKGNYFQMLDFFYRLEGMQRFSSAAALAVQVKSGLIEGKITARVYAYGLASDAAPGVQSNKL